MHFRHAVVTLLLILAACAADRPSAPRATAPTSQVIAPPPPPALVAPAGIRLPSSFRPAAQRVWLTIVPSSPGFSGRTEIDGTLDSATDVVWLNADALQVSAAAAR